jgi:flavin-dependent dehydrogenase
LVLEREATPRPKPGECLSPGFKRLLARLGVADLVESGAHRPFPAIASAWEQPEPVERDLVFEADGEGWLLDRTVFETRLAETARARGALWRQGCQVTRVTPSKQGGWWLTAASARGSVDIEADFVVDATGRAAAVARRLGVPRMRFDGLVGSWGLLVPEGGGRSALPTGGAVHIEAMPSGWWYAARLADGSLSVVRFADRALLDPEAFLGALHETRHVSALLRGQAFRFARPPTAHPAHSARLAEPCGPGWFAIGDAATSFDPLSSYGIGSAMGTGFYAAQALLTCWAGDDTGYDAYRSLIASRYQLYLDTLEERYRAVTRWPEEPFWRQRSGQPPATARRKIGRKVQGGARGSWDRKSSSPVERVSSEECSRGGCAEPGTRSSS